MSRLKTRRGQMEIMGVAVIVLLITVGFMFFLKFNLGKESSSAQKSFQKATVPTYFINSFLETTISPTSCDIRGKMKDLVADCVLNSGCMWPEYGGDSSDFFLGDLEIEEFRDYTAANQGDPAPTNYECIQCQSAELIDSDSGAVMYPATSCGYIYQILDQHILPDTLDQQGKGYIFTLENPTGDLVLELDSGACRGRQGGSTEFKEFILANGERITMTICDV